MYQVKTISAWIVGGLISLASAPTFAQTAGNGTGNILPSRSVPAPATRANAGTEAGQGPKRWVAPGSVDEAIAERTQVKTPAHVRMGVQLVPYHKQTMANQAGPGQSTRFVPGKPLRRTLRSQINRTNHFFVGDWHVESVPLSWNRKTRDYAVRLKVHRRYGAFGQLEEFIGSVDLRGKLVKQGDQLFVLKGRVAKQFRDRMQNPFLDMIAGDGPVVKVPQAKSKLSKKPKVERADRPRAKNARSGSPYIRGRL